MRTKIDLTGRTFGKLTVLKESSFRLKSSNHVYWECKCDCGRITKARSNSLLRGDYISCGCVNKTKLIGKTGKEACNYKHGHRVDGVSRIYTCWANIIQRCNNPKSTHYNEYGGRGIKVCERWLKFENFLQDMGNMPEGLTIDRIDVNGNYELSNCKWSNWFEQAKNRRARKKKENQMQLN